MSRLTHSLSILALAIMAGQVEAFDAPPPPDPKTIEWTIDQANYNLPVFDVQDSKVSDIIQFLDLGERSPGLYLNIDKSEVIARLNTKLTFKEKNISWLKVLSKVADAIDADIEIRPGMFKLVPRKKINPASLDKKDEQDAPSNGG